MEMKPRLYLKLLPFLLVLKNERESRKTVDDGEVALFTKGIDIELLLKGEKALLIEHLGSGGPIAMDYILDELEAQDSLGFHEDCSEHAYVELKHFLLNLYGKQIETPMENYERRRAAELIEAAGIEVEVVYD